MNDISLICRTQMKHRSVIETGRNLSSSSLNVHRPFHSLSSPTHGHLIGERAHSAGMIRLVIDSEEFGNE
ncbi:unnamed protein product [Citrullus colocynthis]|uniref:Uncharacterized protein n=1 Tax=Citrullus colocynthis TaxID=252529 RepID=A0ABP0YH94_9ROSI